MTSPIKSISSPTHPIEFEFGDTPNQAKITINDKYELMLKDFELLAKLAKPHE